MKRTFFLVLAVVVAVSLAGCNKYTWSYCINDVYAAEHVDSGNGVYYEPWRNSDGWVVVDISVTNMTNRPQLLDKYNEQFVLITLEDGIIYYNTAFGESAYGIKWDVPIEGSSTIRAEVYFDASPYILENRTLGFFMMDSEYIEPTGMAIMGLAPKLIIPSDATVNKEVER